MARKLRVGITGVKALRRNLKAVQKSTFDALDQELFEQAEITLDEANQVAPQDTNEMIETSVVTRDSNRARQQIAIAIAYIVFYAIFQHELTFRPGPITESKIGASLGAGRKWLEKTYLRRRPEIIREAGRAVERALITVLR